MARIGRRDLVLLLIGLKPNGVPGDEISGVTRLQKLLFLLGHEEKLHPSGEGFEFQPWKAGPYSPKVYDDLEFLENLGLIEGKPVAAATAAEVAEAEAAADDLDSDDDLTFEALMGSDGVDPRTEARVFEERRFRLTQAGLKRIQDMLEDSDLRPIVAGIRKVKSRYSSYSLNDLLYYVYTKYPDTTVASEIRDKVLSRGRR